MRYFLTILFIVTLWLPAARLHAAGLTVDAAVVPAEWDATAGVEVLVFSSWVRVPRLGAVFQSGTLSLDGGSDLYVRLDGTRVLVLDAFDVTVDGGLGWPHVATGADGALRQWDSVGSAWTVSGIAGETDAPPGVADASLIVSWLSVVAGELALFVGIACVVILVWSLWRRESEF